MDLTNILREIDTQIEQLQKAKALLSNGASPKKRGRPTGVSKAGSSGTKRRTLSAEAKARIAEAQRNR